VASLEPENPCLVLLGQVESAPSHDSTEHEKQDDGSGELAEISMAIVVRLGELVVPVAAVEKSCKKDHEADEPVQPHVEVPVVPKIASSCDLA